MLRHFAWIGTALLAHAARADSLTTDVTPLQPEWPRTQLERPLTLASGMGEVTLDSVTAAPDGTGAQPTTFAADVAYGISDRWTIRAVHVAGYCSSDASSCMTTPREIGLRAQYGAYRGEHVEVAVLGGIEAVAGYAEWGVRTGASFRYRAGSVAIVVEPSLRVGMVPGGSEHPTSLSLPVALQYQTSRTTMLYVRSGLAGYGEDGGLPVDRSITDRYMVPVGAGIVVSLDKHVDLAGELLYPDVAGPLGLGFTAPTLGLKAVLYL